MVWLSLTFPCTLASLTDARPLTNERVRSLSILSPPMAGRANVRIPALVLHCGREKVFITSIFTFTRKNNNPACRWIRRNKQRMRKRKSIEFASIEVPEIWNHMIVQKHMLSGHSYFSLLTWDPISPTTYFSTSTSFTWSFFVSISVSSPSESQMLFVLMPLTTSTSSLVVIFPWRSAGPPGITW